MNINKHIATTIIGTIENRVILETESGTATLLLDEVEKNNDDLAIIELDKVLKTINMYLSLENAENYKNIPWVTTNDNDVTVPKAVVVPPLKDFKSGKAVTTDVYINTLEAALVPPVTTEAMTAEEAHATFGD